MREHDVSLIGVLCFIITRIDRMREISCVRVWFLRMNAD